MVDPHRLWFEWKWHHPRFVVAALVIVWTSSSIYTADALSSGGSVSDLISSHAATIARLKARANELVSSDDRALIPSDNNDDTFYLRYALSPFVSEQKREEAFVKAVQWRLSDDGRSICLAAKKALEECAASSANSWNNAPLRDMAPHSSLINTFISPNNCLTTTSRTGDLVYCIRAGRIDTENLMSTVTTKQLVDFFLYVKEVQMLVANARSNDTLIQVVTANDLAGVKLLGGMSDFRKALSESSTIANDVYPKQLSGTTLILNLPLLLNILVKLFTPIFPEDVRKRLKFEKGVLTENVELEKLGSRNDGEKEREEFLDALDALVYNK